VFRGLDAACKPIQMVTHAIKPEAFQPGTYRLD
jgi:hypothetical protein